LNWRADQRLRPAEHHTTKHPTAILAILAEGIQECLEVFLIPLFATALIPMSFSEMWVTLIYTLYIEILGHSGVRSHWRHTSLFWLDWFGAGLAVEDHDLHHRFGKSGKNYGKQSRLWDAIFGTKGERIETWGM
jgi:sterol desaturase/sphingolipid hydroxylase (fatty acid hydroxylase superfamily)